MSYEIKHRVTGDVIFSLDTDSFKDCLEQAVKQGANLRVADLTPIRDDMWAVLSSAPSEVGGLIKALKEGSVDGSTYQGDCACLVGTLANVAGCDYTDINGLKPDVNRPIERFFLAINKGDTPETSQFSALAVEWAEDWLNRMTKAFTPQSSS